MWHLGALQHCSDSHRDRNRFHLTPINSMLLVAPFRIIWLYVPAAFSSKSLYSPWVALDISGSLSLLGSSSLKQGSQHLRGLSTQSVLAIYFTVTTHSTSTSIHFGTFRYIRTDPETVLCTCVRACADLCADLCSDLCLDLCSDLCSDLCADLCADRQIVTHEPNSWAQHTLEKNRSDPSGTESQNVQLNKMIDPRDLLEGVSN